MCIAIPGRIVECVDPDQLIAQVDVLGTRRAVNVALLTGAIQIGDWVLVHAGSAISLIDQDEALATLAALEEYDRLVLSDYCSGNVDRSPDAKQVPRAVEARAFQALS